MNENQKELIESIIEDYNVFQKNHKKMAEIYSNSRKSEENCFYKYHHEVLTEVYARVKSDLKMILKTKQ